MEKLSDIIARLMDQQGLESPSQVQVLARKWREIVGEELAKRCSPASIRKRVLTVRVSSSTWMQELHFHKGEILKRAAGFLGHGNLDDIKFTTRGSKLSPVEERIGLRAIEGWAMDEKEQSELEEKISSLADEKLKAILRRIVRLHVASTSGEGLPPTIE